MFNKEAITLHFILLHLIFCGAWEESRYHDPALKASDICTFEAEDLCGFQLESHGNLAFWRGSGSTKLKPSDKRPSIDQTTGTASGNYMYAVPSAPTKKGDFARLISPIFNGTDMGRKWVGYYLYQDQGNETDIMTFKVYTKFDYRNNSEHEELWEEVKELDMIWPEWHMYDLEHLPSGPYQVVFEAVAGDGMDSVIAIDDFAIYNAVEDFEGTSRGLPARVPGAL